MNKEQNTTNNITPYPIKLLSPKAGMRLSYQSPVKLRIRNIML